MEFPPHKCSLTLEHNPHRDMYQSVEEYAQDRPDYIEGNWASPEERRNAIETGEMWLLHWCPDTPIGFFVVVASTLEAVLGAAAKVRREK